MKAVREEDFYLAVERVVGNLHGIDNLFPIQTDMLRCIVGQENLFFTAPTNSGKSLPPCMYPDLLHELNKLGYDFPPSPKVLFITNLNSIQLSLITTMKKIGINCHALKNSENIEELLKSDTSVVFVGPEVLKLPSVTTALLKVRNSFVLKVIDESHLG